MYSKNEVEEKQREVARTSGGEANHQLRYFEAKGEKYFPLCGVSKCVPLMFFSHQHTSC